MPMRGEIRVDISPAMNVINGMKKQLDPRMFSECLQITLKDTGNRAVKKILKQEIPKEYDVTPAWVGEKVEKTRLKGTGDRMSCVIPVKGERGTLGGIFTASGGGYAKGKAPRKGKKRKALRKLKRRDQTIKAQVLKKSMSTLPDKLERQGKHPAFRLPNGAVMTHPRNTKRPIVRVVGRAVPQMVDKQFESRIQDPINEYMVKRMDQVVSWKMGIK